MPPYAQYSKDSVFFSVRLFSFLTNLDEKNYDKWKNFLVPSALRLGFFSFPQEL